MQLKKLGNAIPKTRWYRIGFFLFLVYLFAFIDRSNIGMAAPSMTSELGLSSREMGFLLSAFFLGYILTQMPGGWIAQRFSAKWVIIFATTLFGVFSGLTGFMQSIESLVAVRFLLGLAEGAMWPSFMVLTIKWFPVNERAQISGLFLLAVPLSSVVLSPFAGWMIDMWDWKMMFFLQALPPIILAVLAIFLLTDDPAEDKRLSETEREFILKNRGIQTNDVSTQKQPFVKSILSSRLWALGFIYLFWLTGLYAYGLWLPTVVKSINGGTLTTVGLLSALPPLLGSISMFINSRLSDRKMTRGKYVAWPLTLGGTALLVSYFIHDPVLSYLLLCISAIGIYTPFGAWWAWCLDNIPPEHTGSHNGFINLFGNFGGVIGPPIVAFASVGSNIGSGFYILGFGMLLAALLSVLLSISTNRDKALEQIAVKPPSL
ncbi:MFS transporter [Bacillus sp. OK048]|uniref:MFS transporter n=1 Tax=Bacillus sp. OK048 TaxID=1882761 RepID=UPI00087ED509|nr:MFS transporter [Bacillus sp. OK048]SDM15374.1 Sugar phosphate permease [Bacillus sp. OK048]